MVFQNKRVLVTGGAGMIGSTLVASLVSKGCIVTVVDNLWRGKIENLISNGKTIINLETNFLNMDLTDYSNCLKVLENQDIVYHLADVVAGINYVFGNQFSLFHSNIVMNSNVLKASIERGVKKFIYVGTACSCPKEKQNNLNLPLLKEDDAYPANPESSYGWSKLMGEYQCELAEKEGLIEVGVLRLHNVYGPRSEMSIEKSQVIPALIRKAINYPNEDFIVWGSGKQRRAFLYVDDVINALVSVLEKGMGKGVIQIGPDKSISIKEIAERVVVISGKNIDISYDISKMEGDMDRAADWSKAKKILGWQPTVDINDGLYKTFQWCEQYYRK